MSTRNATMKPATMAGILLVILAAKTARASVQQYQFNIVQAQSGVTGTVQTTTSSSGTLIGDWDATSNPSGTRTKPGLFGPFGPTENVAVPVPEFGVSAGGNVALRTAGGFDLDIDASSGTVLMRNFGANFLASGPATLPINLNLLYNAFRTQNPSSVFPALPVPISLPLGNAQLSRFDGAQVGPGTSGSLVQTGPGTYEFVVAPVLLVTLEAEVLGTPLALPPLPLPVPLQGTITVSGTSAVLSSLAPLQGGFTQNPALALPQIPLGLPTVLPPGGTANVLFDLTLDELGFDLELSNALVANGTLIPSPGAGAFAFGMIVLASRRRR